MSQTETFQAGRAVGDSQTGLAQIKVIRLVEGVPTALTNHPVANAIRRGTLGVEIEGLESVVFEEDYSSATMVYPARKKAVRAQVVGRFQGPSWNSTVRARGLNSGHSN